MNITQFEKYVEGCLVTWNHGEFDHELVNLTLGFGGELCEFHHTLLHDTREKQIDEAGDLLYYSTVLLYKITEYKLNKLSIDSNKVLVENVADAMYERFLFPETYPFSIASLSDHDKFYATLQYIGFVLEHVKKYTFHGKPLDDDLISEASLQTLGWLYYILNVYEIELIDVMTYNFGKLSKRYPEGFKKLAEKYKG